MKIRNLVIVCLVLAMLLGMVGCGKTSTESNTPVETTTPEETTTTPALTEKEEEPAEEPKDPVVLEYWYFGDGPQKDTELVNEKFNELLQTYPGMEHVTVHFNPYYGGYEDAVNLALSAGEQIDVMNTFNLSFNSKVADGTFMALDELIQNHEGIVNEVPEWLMNLGKVNGSTYIIPNEQRASNQLYMFVPKVYMDSYGDLAAFKEVFNDGQWTIEEAAEILEEFILACQAGEGATKYGYAMGFATYYPDALKGRGDSIGNLWLGEGSTEVEYALFRDSNKKAYEISADWYNRGLIHPDVLTTSMTDFSGANFLNEVSMVYYFQNGYGSEEFAAEQYSNQTGVDCYAIALYPEYYIGSTWAAGGHAIAAGCEHPEEAMRFIELMHTAEGKDLYNMFVYGLEDVHYTKISENRIETLEYSGSQGDSSVSYSAPKWANGNTLNAWLNQACPDNEIDMIREVNDNPNNVKSAIMGFTVDTSNVSNEIDQCNAIQKEYLMSVTMGAAGDNWENLYNEWVEKMYNAGLQTIIDDYQAQLDAFFAQ